MTLRWSQGEAFLAARAWGGRRGCGRRGLGELSFLTILQPDIYLPSIWKKTSSRFSMSLTLNTCCSLSFLEAKALMFSWFTRGPTPNT